MKKQTSSGGALRRPPCEQKKMSKVMGEFKAKTLTSNKKVVKNPKQAIAIGLNESNKTCKCKKKC